MEVQRFLSHLLMHLPLHAEEGTEREVVAESDLLSTWTGGNDQSAPAALLQMVRLTFDALALLDAALLAEQRWSFVSFPASLMGRSMLAILATPRQKLFPNHYWEQGVHRPSADTEQQRKLLAELETRRERFHPMKLAKPIRVVHVAWGFIKIRDRFLMIHREDRERMNIGNYVFPGGRLNPHDVAKQSRSDSTLRELFDIDSPLALASLSTTLTRELDEECGLLVSHVVIKEPLRLPTYQKVEGAGNRHGLSQYNIVCFPIQLTYDGELQLLQKEFESQDQLVWFSAEELVKDIRIDGKRAFVDALRAFKDQNDDLIKWLKSWPDSSSIRWDFAKETDAIDLPGAPERPIQVGKTGKETPRSVDLSMAEWGLLLLLGWHAKALEVKPNSEHLHLLRNGWVKLQSSEATETIEVLLSKLKKADIPTPQLRNGSYCRLSIDPQHLFFDWSLFNYRLPEGDQDLRIALNLRSVETIWGTLKGTALNIDLPRNMVRVIRDIELGGNADARNIKNDDLPRQIRGIFQGIREIGLRKFIFVAKGQSCLSISAAETAVR